jgi:hypothetical protein
MGMKPLFFVRTVSVNPEYVKPSGMDSLQPVYDISLHPQDAVAFNDSTSQEVLELFKTKYPGKKFERIDAIAFMQQTQTRNQN